MYLRLSTMSSPDVYCGSSRRSSQSLNSSSSSFLNMSPFPVSGSRKRKCFSPRQSSKLDDPNFRGVTIWMENKFVDNDWKLFMRSEYNLTPRKKRKFSSYVESSDEEEPSCGGYNNYATEEKHCASCSAVKTPLWRDAEDGTPLCNACGIRYKKYKLRCGMCWHIPKKDEFSPRCCSCGSFYQYVSPRR